MALRDKVKGLAINAYLSGGADKVRRSLDGAKRRIKGEQERLELYYQVDDPYSYLLAQFVPKLMEQYGIDCELTLVGQPAHDAAPEPDLRARYSIADARELAQYYDVEFPHNGTDAPEDGLVVRANQVMVLERPVVDQLRAARAVSAAVFANDRDAMTKAMGEFGSEASANVKPTLAQGYSRLRKRGHYWGGMIRFGGLWYWGVDRLHYLETALGGSPSLLQVRPQTERSPARLTKEAGERLTLNFYHSLRSPYSYLALARTFELAAQFDMDFNIKPVLPMVMRGFKVPLIKRMYIVRDAKREADRLGVPFGNICDPLGEGIAKCLAIFLYAQREGKGAEFLLSVGRGAWAEALNIASADDLKTIVERAGLSWADAQTAMTDDAWEAMATENRDELKVGGMWGVPGYRAGGLNMWGQDRLDMLEDRLRRHFEAEQ